MDEKVFYSILSIIGFFCVVGLSVNAYFIKEMLESLNQVKVQTAVLIEKSESKEARLSKVEREQDSMRKKFHELINMVNGLRYDRLKNQLENEES
jgi:hypothetical protein